MERKKIKLELDDSKVLDLAVACGDAYNVWKARATENEESKKEKKAETCRATALDYLDLGRQLSDDYKRLSIEGKELDNKVVVLNHEYYNAGGCTKDPRTRLFLCKGGFGLKPYTIGSAVFGHFLLDGERARVERHHIERFATKDEQAYAIKQIKKLRERGKIEKKELD